MNEQLGIWCPQAPARRASARRVPQHARPKLLQQIRQQYAQFKLPHVNLTSCRADAHWPVQKTTHGLLAAKLRTAACYHRFKAERPSFMFLSTSSCTSCNLERAFTWLVRTSGEGIPRQVHVASRQVPVLPDRILSVNACVAEMT